MCTTIRKDTSPTHASNGQAQRPDTRHTDPVLRTPQTSSTDNVTSGPKAYRDALGEGRTSEVFTPVASTLVVKTDMAHPIIGGWGDFRYQYLPDRLQPPPGSSMVNCHGLVVDASQNIILTYEPDHKIDHECLIRWKPDGTDPEHLTGGTEETLCEGTPHGLSIATEGGQQFLYHANNDQKLTKTHLNGSVVWQRNGPFGQVPQDPYKPTWFAVPPDGDFSYLCDGYGSNRVFAFNRWTGDFMNATFGGKGDRSQHGAFSTNHGCTYDPRNGLIAVADRANSRIEYFKYDPTSPKVFAYSHTVDMRPTMGAKTLPCNLRMYPEQQGVAVSPDLAGPVAILDARNSVVSVINVSVLLAAEQHRHPHDAIILPNGDLVVATWAPGRLSYWKRLVPGAAPVESAAS